LLLLSISDQPVKTKYMVTIADMLCDLLMALAVLSERSGGCSEWSSCSSRKPRAT